MKKEKTSLKKLNYDLQYNFIIFGINRLNANEISKLRKYSKFKMVKKTILSKVLKEKGIQTNISVITKNNQNIFFIKEDLFSNFSFLAKNKIKPYFCYISNEVIQNTELFSELSKIKSFDPNALIKSFLQSLQENLQYIVFLLEKICEDK